MIAQDTEVEVEEDPRLAMWLEWKKQQEALAREG